jgi:hypothetical protein
MGHGSPFKKRFWEGNVIRPLGRLGGNDKYGNYSAYGMIEDPKSAAIEADKAKAEAEAQAKQAEFEASQRAGLERLAQKRRRGYGASMIVQPTLGSSATLGS